MSNALDVISLEQLEKLKKLGLVVVHSKPTKNMFKAVSLRKANKGISWADIIPWDIVWNTMVGASINQQASEVDWSKHEKAKVTVTWDKAEPKANTKVVFASTPYQRDGYFYNLWENAIAQNQIPKPKVDGVKSTPPKFNTEPEYLKYIEAYVKQIVTNELRNRNIK